MQRRLCQSLLKRGREGEGGEGEGEGEGGRKREGEAEREREGERKRERKRGESWGGGRKRERLGDTTATEGDGAGQWSSMLSRSGGEVLAGRGPRSPVWGFRDGDDYVVASVQGSFLLWAESERCSLLAASAGLSLRRRGTASRRGPGLAARFRRGQGGRRRDGGAVAPILNAQGSRGRLVVWSVHQERVMVASIQLKQNLNLNMKN
jgi:hypothetical protein